MGLSGLCAVLFASTPAVASVGAEGGGRPSRVANGEAVEECGFAPVAFMGNCTAVLAHPEIILYAQHCGSARTISLTHKSGAGRKLEFEFCKLFPGSWSMPKDFAFCKLKAPVEDIAPIPIAFGCELDDIKAGSPIIHIGFGDAASQGGFGTKRWGENTIGSITPSGDFKQVNTSPNKVASCQGDSGGPLLVKMKDDTWRTIGVASTLSGGCGSSNASNVYAWTPGAVEWLEKESGVDVTPCFDPDGTWKPTKECGKFYKGDHNGHGTWADGCKGTPVSGYSSICGPAFDGSDGDGGGEESGEESGEDVELEIEISSPEDGDEFNLGSTVDVKIKISGDEEIVSVELLVDGESFAETEDEPYRFKLEDLEEGSYTLVAAATDKDDNRVESKEIAIEVIEEDSATSEDTESGDSDDSGTAKGDESTGDEDDSSGENSADRVKSRACGCQSSPEATPIHAGMTFLLGLWGYWRRKKSRA